MKDYVAHDKEQFIRKNANRKEWQQEQFHPDQDAASIMGMCPPWSKLIKAYQAIDARMQQLVKLYEHYNQQMDQWEMDIPLQPMWSFQREMTKIDKMCLSKQAFDEFDELSINRPSKQSAGYIVNKHQLLTISKQHTCE
ncbi:unnamed protein product [Effrenium voratum]|nr:unnamed protein product [Effrenium voratum]